MPKEIKRTVVSTSLVPTSRIDNYEVTQASRMCVCVCGWVGGYMCLCVPVCVCVSVSVWIWIWIWIWCVCIHTQTFECIPISCGGERGIKRRNIFIFFFAY